MLPSRLVEHIVLQTLKHLHNTELNAQPQYYLQGNKNKAFNKPKVNALVLRKSSLF